MSAVPACPGCGASLAAFGTPQGLCARCMLSAAKDAPEIEVLIDSEPPPPKPPTVEELAAHFPGLELVELIGCGGMGAVYKARQKGLDRMVALKVLHAHVAARPGFAERFGREARTLAVLQHENIVSVHESGQAGPWFYFVMEHVDGPHLRQLLRAGHLEPRQALQIVSQVCAALQYAHDQGVVHRDIKPENILVDRGGRVRILDFGLSKLIGARDNTLTRTHQVMGTPHYMAPEQWDRPREVDHRADIYALGVVFYELLTGELPVGRFEPPSRRVAVDVRLDEVVLRALERAPERRYQQASEVKSRVDEIAAAPAPAPGDPIAANTGARTGGRTGGWSSATKRRLAERAARRQARRAALATGVADANRALRASAKLMESGSRWPLLLVAGALILTALAYVYFLSLLARIP